MKGEQSRKVSTCKKSSSDVIYTKTISNATHVTVSNVQSKTGLGIRQREAIGSTTRLRNKAAFLDDGLGENPRATECCIMFGGH